jgi:hypothetical protein
MRDLTARVIVNIETLITKVLHPGMLPATFAPAKLPPVTDLPGGAFPPFHPPPHPLPHNPPTPPTGHERP